MSKNKKYKSFKIPDRQQVQRDNGAGSLPQLNTAEPSSLADGMFYEIEYDSCPVPGAGKYVLKTQKAAGPQKVTGPKKDEIREIFNQMREITRAHRSTYDFSKFFDRRVQHDNAVIFYKQGMFMKDFTDNHEGNTPFSQYFPCYQMMGYEQLRTYFTWRTEVRKGNVADTSLSYAFLYIYELLGNIGVENPQDGLDKLMFFRKAFGVHNKSIDKYVIRWLKDYHIYYKLPQPFKEFVKSNVLTEYYPNIAETDDSFNLFCAISKYNIKKSVFYTDETSKMITDCFSFVMKRIRQDFEAAGIHFDDALFRPTRKIIPWKPFKDALFYQWAKQSDRRIVLSENEIYICSHNEWTSSTIITTEKGRQFIGYVMKQMEVILRKVTKYRFKITANTNMIHEETIRKLTKAGLLIEKIVPAAVMEYYREATKTVITVDHASLARIRQEALVTQEALIVEEQAEQKENTLPPVLSPVPNQNIFSNSSDTESEPFLNSWESLKDALSENELQALAVILLGDNIKVFADECGIMLEVLIDGINEKAMDYIGDNLMDEEFVLYDDYKEQVKELIG